MPPAWLAAMTSSSSSIDTHVLQKYQVERKIGSGSYGQVWKCIKKGVNGTAGGQTSYALKKVYEAFDNSTDAQRTFREVVILFELEKHPNIISLYEVHRSKDNRHLYMVFEYVESDLQEAITARALQPVHQQFILYQLLCALRFLHSANVVHRDLKPSNILLNNTCEAKVCDFGFARSVDAIGLGSEKDVPVTSAPPKTQIGLGGYPAASKTLDRKAQDRVEAVTPATTTGSKDPVLTDGVSTRWFRSPELLLGSTHYDQSVDIWSAGCILGEMLRGSPIFAGESILQQLQLIFALLGKPNAVDMDCLAVDCRRFAKEIMPCVSDTSELHPSENKRHNWAIFFPSATEQALDLLRQLLKFVATQRPTAATALRHKYVKEFCDSSKEQPATRIIKLPLDDNLRFNKSKYLEKLIDNFNFTDADS